MGLSQIYIYLLSIVCLIVAFIGVMIFIHKESDKIVKIIVVWYVILMEINLINMIFILKGFNKTKYKTGPKGRIGETGNVGLQGDSVTCSGSCGDDGLKRDTIYARDYYLDVSGNKVLPQDNIKNEVVKGKCVFPFIYDYQKFSSPLTPYQDYLLDKKKIKQTGPNGWCPTSLNNTIQNGSNVRTWGYAESKDDSIINAREIQLNNQRKQQENNYIRNNSGVLDLRVVMGDRSNVSCPSGYEPVMDSEGMATDMNYQSGGKYIYLCQKKGLASAGISDVTVVDDYSKCSVMGANYSPVNVVVNDDSQGGGTVRLNSPANLNEGIKNSNPKYLCKKLDDRDFLTNIDARFTASSGTQYPICEVDLNPATKKPVYLCPKRDEMSADIINTCCVYQDNLYLFFGDNYFKYDKSANTILRNSVSNQIEIINNNRKWGDISDINAILNYDKNLYFFKGNNVYLYDDEKQKIAEGYPKSIQDVFKGVPNNIDACFTWALDGKTYFFKGNYYYLYNNRNNKVETGYPKLIKNRWTTTSNKPVPTFLTSVYNYNGKSYAIQGTQVYEFSKDGRNINPIDQIGTMYPGITNAIGCLIKTKKDCEKSGNGCKYLEGDKMCIPYS